MFEGCGAVHYSVEQVGFNYLRNIQMQAGFGQLHRQGHGREHITRFTIRAKAEVAAYFTALWPHVFKKRQEIEVALDLLYGRITARTARSRIDAIRAAYKD